MLWSDHLMLLLEVCWRYVRGGHMIQEVIINRQEVE